MTRRWMIRAGDNNELIPIWKEKGIASIGWPQFGNPKQYVSKTEMVTKANEIYSDEKLQTRSS